jgi:hypothetical protein
MTNRTLFETDLERLRLPLRRAIARRDYLVRWLGPLVKGAAGCRG